MSGRELLQEARRRGLTLAEGETLAVTPALCSLDFAATLREQKSELLALLAEARGVCEKVKPDRPPTERERYLLRRAGAENDPLIIEALNLFDGKIVELSR